MANKEEKYFWHGKGVILIAGDTYHTGNEIPAKSIEPKALKAFMKAGDISTAEVDVAPSASETIAQAKYRELKKAYDKLAAENKKLAKGGKAKGEACKECPAKDERIAELEADVEEKAALIESLKADLEAATAPDAGGAG
jgi:predicted RNase H-like nuclease (RuvC/YqgF family)